jgi:hypothetical protein
MKREEKLLARSYMVDSLLPKGPQVTAWSLQRSIPQFPELICQSWGRAIYMHDPDPKLDSIGRTQKSAACKTRPVMGFGVRQPST